MAKGMKELKETTRDRHLMWINHYSNNNFGIWIECTKCKKWRISYNYSESHEVAENWCCSMNTLDNGAKGNCDDPEENSDEDYLEYSPGSIVWAKLDGYPWWPAMVDEDPDVEEYYWVERNNVFYNVTFLDEQVTRAWISSKSICPYLIPPHRNKHLLKHQKKYSSAIRKAEEKAEIAVKMAFKDRLQNYSFAFLYKGKWPFAKDNEPEEDSRDITDILLDEVDDMDSLLSFDTDVPDNFTLLEKEKNLHEESRTVLSGVKTSVNAVTSKKSMGVAGLKAGTKNHNVLCAGKKQSNMNLLPEIKDSKDKDELKITGRYCNNISKNKIQSFENCTKIIKRSENSNVSGGKIEFLMNKIKTNIDTNKKDDMLNDGKGNSSYYKNLDICDNNNKVEQNVKNLKIVEHELDRNSSTEEKNFKCKTSTPNMSSVFSEISNSKNMDNIDKSIDWVVYKYEIIKDIGNKETNNDKPSVTKEIKKFEINKSSKTVLNGKKRKEISFPPNKHWINGVNMNKIKERPEISLGSNANGQNKKLKPSFNCSKQSFKAIKKETQGSLKKIKQYHENRVTENSDITELSNSPNTKVSSNDKNISLEGNTTMLSNSNKVNNTNEMEFEYQESNPELIVKCNGPLNICCSSSSELSDVNSSSSKSGISKKDKLISTDLSLTSNNLSNTEMKEKTNKKDSETAIYGTDKSKKLMKIHKKMKPVLPKNNKIMEPKFVSDKVNSDIITELPKSLDSKLTSGDSKNISLEGNTGLLPNSNKFNNADKVEFEYQKSNSKLNVKCNGPLNNCYTSNSELSDVNFGSSKSGIYEEDKCILNYLTPKETSNNLSNIEMKDETNKKGSETAIYGAAKSKKLMKIHKKIKPVLPKNYKIMKPKIETKPCKNVTEIHKTVCVEDDNSTSPCSVHSPSKIKNLDVGFFDISLSDEEFEI